MRRLEEYEEIGLIGYPRDGDYIAVLGGPKRQSWLLGGELCGLDGAALADQAADLPRFYPQGSRLVLVTITDNWIIALRDYDTARDRPKRKLLIARTALAPGQDDPSNRRRSDLQAAEMLRKSGSLSFDAGTESDILAVAAEMSLDRLDVIRLAVGEWLTMRKGVPFPMADNAPYRPVVPVRSDIRD